MIPQYIFINCSICRFYECYVYKEIQGGNGMVPVNTNSSLNTNRTETVYVLGVFVYGCYYWTDINSEQIFRPFLRLQAIRGAAVGVFETAGPSFMGLHYIGITSSYYKGIFLEQVVGLVLWLWAARERCIRYVSSKRLLGF